MINNTNSNNKENFNNKSSDANIAKSRSVQIYHADAKPVLYAMAFNTIALAIIAVGVIMAIVNVKHEIKEVNSKVAGIVIGLTAGD